MKKSYFSVAIIVAAANLFLISGCDVSGIVAPADNPTSALTVEPSVWSAGTAQTAGWVMSYFGTNGNSGTASDMALLQDSLHLAFSTDGLNWRPLKYNKAVHTVNIGSGHIRDPFIFRKNDGSFVLLATDWTRAAYTVPDSNYWNRPSPYIYVADSTDLITFKNGRLLKLCNQLGTNTSPHAWAPEAVYDPDKKMYAIYWSGNDQASNSIYVSYTADFMTVTNLDEPKLFFNPGYTVIDATFLNANSKQYMFFKDESWDPATGRGKDIQGAVSANLSAGSFVTQKVGVDNYYLTRGTNQVQVDATEGAFVIKDPASIAPHYFMFADLFNKNGQFGCWASYNLDDPASWGRYDVTMFRMPYNVRHGAPVRVTQTELDNLIAKIGAPAGSTMIRTTYTESSGLKIFYIAQKANAGIIAYDGDMGQEDRAFYWHQRPGLSNPSDPTLVSFESADTPGQYLWVDSAAAYITKVSASPVAATATFKLLPALNLNTSMKSIQWTVDPTRYLVHGSYKISALVPSTAQNNIDSSFLLEAQ